MIALGVFASILVHELGHAIAAQRKGAEVTDITVMLLGGITKIKQQGGNKHPAQPSKLPSQVHWPICA